MDIFSVLTLLGGLALFLYGMSVMGNGLERLSGGKLERILEKLTSNRLKGVLLGAGVTAIIQSSSATTVMVVGFVNSGIMKLSQAISIIMGANIGTTATSWILSLGNIEGDSFFVKMLNPSSFSPILAVIGIALIMFSKKDSRKNLGEIFLGFAILMFGMETMSGAVEPLKDVPEFTNILLMFSNPVLGVLVGALLTAVIQSSSASVGILQALSSTGQIQFGSAIPIIMGQNIGTCVTALISSVGTNKNARRTALVHLYFNIIGTVVCLTAFYILNAIFKFAFINDAVDSTKIAIVHTIFNLVTTSILLPFTKQLEKLSYLSIKDSAEDIEKEQEFQLLDDRFLSSPSFAVEQCRSLTIKMSELVKHNFMLALKQVNEYSEKEASEIVQNENLADTYEDKLGNYLVKLSSKSLSDTDSNEIAKLLHVIGDLERISDHSLNIMETAKEMYEKKISFSEKAKSEMDIIGSALTDIVSVTISAFENDDAETAKKVEPIEEVVDNLRNELKSRHIRRLQEGKCTIELGFIFSDLLTNYERVADHCSNIAIYLIQGDNFEAHEYLNHIKGEEFNRQYEQCCKKYLLPV